MMKRFYLQQKEYNDLYLLIVGEQQVIPEQYYKGIREKCLLHFVLEGKGNLEINKQVHRIEKGSVFFVPPDITCSYYPDKDDPWHYLWLQFDGKLALSMVERAGFGMVNPVQHPEKFSSIVTDIRSMFRLLENEKEGYLIRVNGLLYSVLGKLIESSKITPIPPEAKQGNLTRHILKAYDFINNNYQTDFSIGNLSEYLGLNRSYFSHLFKSYEGITIQQYIIQFRLNKARNLLENTGLSVKEISYSVGYKNYVVFAKAFRKHLGMSPSDYRKKHSPGK